MLPQQQQRSAVGANRCLNPSILVLCFVCPHARPVAQSTAAADKPLNMQSFLAKLRLNIAVMGASIVYAYNLQI